MPRPLLHFVDTGAPSSKERPAPAVLLLHAFPFHHGMWQAQVDPLRSIARVIACDLPGFGQSEGARDHLMMLEHMVEDVKALLDHLGIEQVAMAGLSMGGYVALRFAERWPERIAGLALLNTRSEADAPAAKMGRAATMNLLDEQGVEAFAAAFLPTVFAATTLSSKPDVVAAAKAMVIENSATRIRAGLVALATRTDTTAALASFGFPVVTIVGEHDGLTPPELSIRMAQLARDGVCVVVPEAGHLSAMENPNYVNVALRSWLDTIRRKESS